MHCRETGKDATSIFNTKRVFGTMWVLCVFLVWIYHFILEVVMLFKARQNDSDLMLVIVEL